MEASKALCEGFESDGHFAQLYGHDDRLLIRNVSLYLSGGLERGDGLLVIATPEHVDAIALQLEARNPLAARAVRDGRLVYFDAATTVDALLADGQLNWESFERVIGGTIHRLQQRVGRQRIRAFGEMVGILWTRGQRAAAATLEGYWSDLLRANGVSLFCGYPIDVFAQDFEVGALQPILAAHGHVIAGPRTVFSGAPPAV